MMDKNLHVVDRRTTLKWLMAGVGATPIIAACDHHLASGATKSPSLLGTPKPIMGTPYGVDPDMLDPRVTWERTMTRAQKQLVAALSDIVMPETNDLPAASMLGIQDFVDEWVSSPYEMTQPSRLQCFELFEWLEREARSKGAASFASAPIEQKKALLDRVAWRERVEDGLNEIAEAFDAFRNISISAYFCSVEGSEWLGYRGNRPAAGDYAGPTPEALEHLSDALSTMSLSLPAGL